MMSPGVPLDKVQGSNTGPFRIVQSALIELVGEQRLPGVESALFCELSQAPCVRVCRMELLEIVLCKSGDRLARLDAEEYVSCGAVKVEPEGIVVDLFDALVDVRLHLVLGEDIGMRLHRGDVFPPEYHVVGGERGAVGPLQALAEMDDPGAALVFHVVALGQVGVDIVGPGVFRYPESIQAVRLRPIGPGFPRVGHIHGAAIFADLLSHNERFVRKPGRYRWQFSCGNQRAQSRSFLELTDLVAGGTFVLGWRCPVIGVTGISFFLGDNLSGSLVSRSGVYQSCRQDQCDEGNDQCRVVSTVHDYILRKQFIRAYTANGLSLRFFQQMRKGVRQRPARDAFRSSARVGVSLLSSPPVSAPEHSASSFRLSESGLCRQSGRARRRISPGLPPQGQPPRVINLQSYHRYGGPSNDGPRRRAAVALVHRAPPTCRDRRHRAARRRRS